jgi:hypothetical protein
VSPQAGAKQDSLHECTMIEVSIGVVQPQGIVIEESARQALTGQVEQIECVVIVGQADCAAITLFKS